MAWSPNNARWLRWRWSLIEFIDTVILLIVDDFAIF
jgi:hypothetical protein